jgi:hypothetical protein
MQFNNRPKPVSFLQGVIADGGKPFLYRNRVYSLLGVTDNVSGKRIRPLALSFTDFPYAYLKFKGDQNNYSINESGRSVNAMGLGQGANSSDKTGSASSRFILYSSETKPQHTDDIQVPDKNIVSRKETLINEIHLPGKTASNLKPFPVSIETKNKIQEPAERQMVVTMSSIEPVNQSKSPEILVENSVQLDGKPELLKEDINQSRIDISGTTPGNNIIHRSDTNEDNLQNNQNIQNRHNSNVLQLGDNDNYPVNQNAGKNKVNVEIGRKPPGHLSDDGEELQRVESLKISKSTLAIISEVRSSVIQKNKMPVVEGEYGELSMFQDDSTDLLNDSSRHLSLRSDEKAIRRIERLRDALNQLAFKTTRLEKEKSYLEDEKHEHERELEQLSKKQAQPQMIQRIFINRSSQKGGTPYAFWERSNLSRFHLKFLR